MKLKLVKQKKKTQVKIMNMKENKADVLHDKNAVNTDLDITDLEGGARTKTCDENTSEPELLHHKFLTATPSRDTPNALSRKKKHDGYTSGGTTLPPTSKSPKDGGSSMILSVSSSSASRNSNLQYSRTSCLKIQSPFKSLKTA